MPKAESPATHRALRWPRACALGQHLQGQLRLGSILTAVCGHSRRGAPVRVRSPFLGQIQALVRQRTTQRPHMSQKHPGLAVGDLSQSSAVLPGHSHRFHALFGEIAAALHPHRLSVSQLGAQVFLQASYDSAIVPAGLGEKALHGPGRGWNGLGEILGVATLLGLDQQGLEIVPAVFPLLLASEGCREEGMELAERLVNPFKRRHIHHPASSSQSTTTSANPNYTTRRCNTRSQLRNGRRLLSYRAKMEKYRDGCAKDFACCTYFAIPR